MSAETTITNIGKKQHILVCLSASPSNEKIVQTAANMAEVLSARFTALYVNNDFSLTGIDKKRLDMNIQFAEKLGADVVTVHGEDIAMQIAEYARLSDVTKIVIGQSNAKRSRIWSGYTLTEKLIAYAPDIDIHIIPDAGFYKKSRKSSLFVNTQLPTMQDVLTACGVLALCTAIGFLFLHLGFNDTNIVTVYIFGVLVVSAMTKGYICSIASSLLSVFLFGFFLTEPHLSFKTYAVGYPVTFAVMLSSSVLTGTLASQLKKHAKLSAQSAFRMQILFDTDRLLQKAKNSEEILSITCMQLSKLLDRCIVAYKADNDILLEGRIFPKTESSASERLLNGSERSVAEWVYKNGHCAGATTSNFSNAGCLYLSIRIEKRIYGVIGIPMKKNSVDSFENSVLLSVLNECALAMDNAHNAAEKEKAADFAKSEQLRADLLRSISHDLRTPLCSISGNADTLLHNSDCLDEDTKRQIYADIYDDSEWLTGVVENLLYVTRLNDGRLKLNLTDQLADEVIAEAVSHLCRKSSEHTITVRCEDLLLVRMDAQLIIQVLVNLIDNAIKYTPAGSEIRISAQRQGDYAIFKVSDNGNGIPDDVKPHIFEMFYTGKNKISDSRRSFGLGLTLCKSIIDVHGGSLELADNIPHGCIFTFNLPISEVTLNE